MCHEQADLVVDLAGFDLPEDWQVTMAELLLEDFEHGLLDVQGRPVTLKEGATTWGTDKKTYKTGTSKETRTLNFKMGTYRVVVKGKYGYQGTTSGEVYRKK